VKDILDGNKRDSERGVFGRSSIKLLSMSSKEPQDNLFGI